MYSQFHGLVNRELLGTIFISLTVFIIMCARVCICIFHMICVCVFFFFLINALRAWAVFYTYLEKCLFSLIFWVLLAKRGAEAEDSRMVGKSCYGGTHCYLLRHIKTDENTWKMVVRCQRNCAQNSNAVADHLAHELIPSFWNWIMKNLKSEGNSREEFVAKSMSLSINLIQPLGMIRLIKSNPIIGHWDLN